MIKGLQSRAGVNLLYVTVIFSSPDPLREGERAMHKSVDEAPVTMIVVTRPRLNN